LAAAVVVVAEAAAALRAGDAEVVGEEVGLVRAVSGWLVG
jgi:hypothetical protein